MDVDGLLIINKPAGLTSHDVVVQARRLLEERRIGHTGTLDPFATGVLALLVGKATRLAQFLSGLEKEYEAVIRIGYATDTGDVTGNRLTDSAETRSDTEFHRKEIEAALTTLSGEIEQTPPMYSARKIAGERLYRLARRGEQVERAPARIHVKNFELASPFDLLPRSNEDGTRDLPVRVVCSAGTYIRVLAEDFGKHLGIGAHLAELRRTRVGTFRIDHALSLERLDDVVQSGCVAKSLFLPDDALRHLAAFDLDSQDSRRVMNGIDLKVDHLTDAQWRNGQAIRLRTTDGQLLAVGTYDAERMTLHPSVVLSSYQRD